MAHFNITTENWFLRGKLSDISTRMPYLNTNYMHNYPWSPLPLRNKIQKWKYWRVMEVFLSNYSHQKKNDIYQAPLNSLCTINYRVWEPCLLTSIYYRTHMLVFLLSESFEITFISEKKMISLLLITFKHKICIFCSIFAELCTSSIFSKSNKLTFFFSLYIFSLKWQGQF